MPVTERSAYTGLTSEQAARASSTLDHATPVIDVCREQGAREAWASLMWLMGSSAS